MHSIAFLMVCSFILSLLLTRAVRDVAVSFNIYDRPDQDRKRHRQPVPRLGGVAVIVAYAAAVLLLVASPLRGGVVLQGHLWFMWTLFPAIAVVFAVGLADDLLQLSPWQKLAGQVAAGVYAYLVGVRISGIGEITEIGWWSLPLTVGWLVVCTNSFNLIDGLDGLATGVAIVASVTVLCAAFLQSNYTLALTVAPLLGSLCGFLRYNSNPASIFLGDCGSLVIGFLLGCCAVIWSQKAATLIAFTAPLVALAVPLLDTTLAITRRFLSLRPIFGADRAHVHHRLLDLGNSPRRVVFLLYIACVVAALLSLSQSLLNARFAGAVVVVICAAVVFSVRKLRYAEFETASRLILQGAFRRMLVSNVVLDEFERSLRTASSVDACWDALRTSCRQFGFSSVRLCIAPVVYEDFVHDVNPNECWVMRVPIAGYGYINLTRPLGADTEPLMVSRFIASVHHILQEILPALQSQGAPVAAQRKEALRRPAAAV